MVIKKILRKIKYHSPISIGMRTFKTWIAATLTAIVALTPIIGNPFYALMGTVFGMQSTVADSFKMGQGRVIGTTIGAFIGFIFTTFDLTAPPFVALAIVLAIIICGLLKINHSILITVTLCLLIMFNPEREGVELIHYTLFRTLDTALGVVIGFLINRFIAPPNHLKSLVSELAILNTLTKTALEDDNMLPQLKKELISFMRIHTNYQADEKYDNYDISNENLRQTVEACRDLYFHFQHCKATDPTVKQYHTHHIHQTAMLLENTLDELKHII